MILTHPFLDIAIAVLLLLYLTGGLLLLIEGIRALRPGPPRADRNSGHVIHPRPQSRTGRA